MPFCIHHFILIVLSLLLLSNCKTDAPKFKTLDDETLIDLVIKDELPDPAGLTIHDVEGKVISADSLRSLQSTGNYFLDFYIDDKEKIVGGLVRPITDKDKKLIERINEKYNESLKPKIDIDLAKLQTSIENLKTNDHKKAFLEKILEEDQGVRKPGVSANLKIKYGEDSQEYNDYYQAQWKQDAINLVKVEKYIATFGYPSKKDLGDKAATAPFLVIQHSTDSEARDRNFESLYKAYLEDNIDDTAMSFYLGRNYDFKFGKRFDMPSPYKSVDEINQLIKELGLEERQISIQEGVKR